MDAIKLADVKRKLFDDFLPLGVDASVIELIIDELDGNEEKCRHHLDSIVSGPCTLQNSPPVPRGGAGDMRSGNGSSPPVSEPAPAGWPGSPRTQCGPAPSARQDGPPASHRGTPGAGYGGAAARGATASCPAPAWPPLPPMAASSDCSTPLQQKLAAGMPLLVLMRGLPGSGKSTLARQMANQQGIVVSADDFFTEHGRYVFRPDRLPDAHEWCRNQVRRALRRGQSPVIVDNTNTEAWEMTPYVELAVQLDYFVEIAEPTTPWRHDPKLLSRRSVHLVPERSIERMMDRFQGSDRVNVVSLHRMIGKQPKPWPPMEPAAVAATGNVAPSDTPAVGAASAGAQGAPAAAPAPPPSSDPRGVITMADMAVALDQSWAEVGAAATRRLWSAPALGPAAAAAPAPVTGEAGVQTGGGMAGRSMSPRPWQGAPDGEAGPPPLTVPLHRGTMTSPPPDGEEAKLQSLSDLFPTVGKSDLVHILEQCGGNLQWATNVLLDTNLEPVEPAAAAEPAVVAADPAPPPSAGQGGARPKEPSQLGRQYSEDSGPDVIVEDLTDSEADRPVVAAADSSGGSSGQSTPFIVGEPVGELALQLPARLAYQLQELFGPTAFGARTEAQLAQLPAAELTVRLPLDVARHLHYCWTSGADRALQEEQRSFDQLRAQLEVLQQREEEARQALLRNDEEIARQLQMEENGQRAAVAGSATSPTPQLRQIMAEQQASQHSERAQSGAGLATQAERMTRQRLQEEFPGVDPPYLNELLDMHDGDYRQVLRVLQDTRGERPRQTAAIRAPPPPAATGGALGGPTGDFLIEDGMPSFHDIRAESELVRQKIAHAKTMAERAIRRGDYSVSQYYVDERDRLYKVLNECNMRATVVTMELQQDADPNRLDLHHLLVEDAKEQLASFIADRQNYFGRNGIRSKTVEIITGKGNNSKYRKPKIKPAVEQWLQNKGFQFREADGNSGMLIVTVHSEHLYRPQI